VRLSSYYSLNLYLKYLYIVVEWFKDDVFKILLKIFSQFLLSNFFGET